MMSKEPRRHSEISSTSQSFLRPVYHCFCPLLPPNRARGSGRGFRLGISIKAVGWGVELQNKTSNSPSQTFHLPLSFHRSLGLQILSGFSDLCILRANHSQCKLYHSFHDHVVALLGTIVYAAWLRTQIQSRHQ